MERMQLIMLLRVFILIVSLLLVEYYFLNRLKHSLLKYFSLNEKQKKRILMLFVVILNLYPLYYIINLLHLVLFPASEVEFPDTWTIDFLFRLPGWFLIVWIVQTTIIALPVEIIVYGFLKLKNFSRAKFQNYSYKLFSIVAVFFLIYIPLRIYYDSKNVIVEKRIYEINDAKRELDGLRIVFISDIQMDRFTHEARVKNYINKVNELKPDLVLISGDFIASKDRYIHKVANLVGRINFNLGVYSCVGDHDFFVYKKDYWRSLDTMKNVLKRHNVNMIDNGNVTFQINEARIKVTFLTNTYVKSTNTNVLDSLAKNNDRYNLKILVSHQPDEIIANKASQLNYNLYLAGHTHGGQVRLIFPFINLTPVMLETSFLAGDFKFGHTHMIVNRGLGYSTIPFRYNVTPEISLIVIKNKEE